MKINLNDQVSVKLTPFGQARWRGLYGTTPSAFLVMPLWELMTIFGPSLHIGMPEVCFVDNEIEVLGK